VTPRVLASVIAVLLACYCLMRLRAWLASQWFLVQLWRWHTGQPHHGKPVTDRGWFRHGQRALTLTGHATRWQHLPRWRQTVHRTGATLAAVALLWGFLAYPLATGVVVASACAATAVFGLWRAVTWLRARRDRRTWQHPLHLALHEIAGIPRAALASSWIKVTTDDDGAVTWARLELPQGWPADERDQARLVAVTSAKLAIEAPEVKRITHGPRPVIELTRSQPPPQFATLRDVAGEMDRCAADEVMVGIGK
jgi:hypothetical protein